MVGLGFAMMENIGYYIGALVRPEVGGVKLLGATFVLRGVLSPLAHPIFTSMTGLGVAYAATHRNARWAVPAGLLAAMLLHGTWNGLTAFGLARAGPRLRHPGLRAGRPGRGDGRRPAPDRAG